MNAKSAPAEFAGVVSVEDVRALAARRLPRFVFDLVDGGAGEEATLRANRIAFADVQLRPRAAVAIGQPDLKVEIFGETFAAPILAAPCGSARQLHPDGELAIARAAASLGLAYVVPHLGSHALEDIRQAAPSPLWYQLYLMSDRERERRAVGRALAAGYSALVLTVDTPAQGLRERDHRNGLNQALAGSRAARLKLLPQLLSHPRWFAGYLKDGARIDFPNMNAADLPPLSPADLLAATAQVARPATWADIAWLRALWPKPIIVKGVLTAEDARRAVDAGCDGVIVSNHGGRQLDGAAPSLMALAEVASEVGAETALFLDSGVRRGADIVKALAFGARAVLVGRPVMFGLAAGGEPGVRKVLEVLTQELKRTLILMGREAVSGVNGDAVSTPSDWRRSRG